MSTSKNEPMTTYFILTLILAMPAYILLGLTAHGVILSPDLAVSFVPLAVLAPLVAALILTYKKGGLPEVKALLWRTLDFKRTTNKSWLVVALLVPPIIVLIAWSIATALGFELLPAQIPLIAAPIAFAAFSGSALSEQLGWMGYAYEPMESRWDAFKAALVLGFLIAAFHVPLYYFLIDDPLMLAVQILFPISLRLLAVWIYNNAGKSIFAATIFHAVYNTCYSVFEVNLFVSTPLSVIFALAIVYLWTPRTMADFRLRKIGG